MWLRASSARTIFRSPAPAHGSSILNGSVSTGSSASTAQGWVLYWSRPRDARGPQVLPNVV
jgi:hypothetical protein